MNMSPQDCRKWAAYLRARAADLKKLFEERMAEQTGRLIKEAEKLERRARDDRADIPHQG